MNDDLLILASLPRSGSSWLYEIVASSGKFFLFNEPDNSRHKRSHLNKLPFHIKPDQKNPRYSSWLLDGIEQMRSLSFIYRKDMYRLNYGLAVEKIKRLSGLTERKITGFKTVNSQYRLGWMRKTLNYPKTIFLLRNPFGFTSSRLKLGEIKKIKTHLPDEFKGVTGFNINELSDLQKIALSWRLQNERCISENIDTENFKIIVYENLAAKPLEVSEEIFRFLGLGLSKNSIDYINRSIDPGRSFFSQLRSKDFFGTVKDPQVSVNKWKDILSHEERKSIYDIVKDSWLMKFWETLY